MNDRVTPDLAKLLRRDALFVDIIDNHCLAMQAALIEGHLRDPASGLKWIANTLRGPGLLPDVDEAEAIGGAQAWFDAKSAESDELRRQRIAALIREPIVSAETVDLLKRASAYIQASVRTVTGDDGEPDPASDSDATAHDLACALAHEASRLASAMNVAPAAAEPVTN
jgi:hypothetical protein